MRHSILLAVMVLLSIACTDNNFTNSNKEHDMSTEVANTTDQAAIQDLINTFFKQVDQRNWSEVKSKMTDSVYTDYTALGGQAGFFSPNEILTGWKGMLPGFERTIHQVHNEAIWIAGDRASATLDAIATHYLTVENGDNYWTVFVGYDTEFIKEDGAWKMARIDLSLYDQMGNGNLPQAAIANVQSGNIPAFTETSKATEAVERFFKALENNDLNAFMDNIGENAVQQMPLAPANFPKSLNGKVAFENQYKGVMDYTQKYERTYFPTQNPNVVLAQYKGTVVTEAGKDYNNYYVSIFEVDEAGKLIKNVEHFNPNILLSSWTGLQPETYSVHQAGAKRAGGVKMEDISFNSNGVTLKGHLFLPSNFDANKKYPTTIVTGSWTSVKEQMPDEYASLMAKEGYLSLTFDFTGFGESEGQPRQVEDYNLKIADIKAAVDYLINHPNVETESLIGMGFCASSGYMAHATAQDNRIKNLVLVAPWLHNPEIAKSIYDMRPGKTEGLLAAARDAKVKYAETGEMEYVLAASELDPYSAMYVPTNVFDYYLDPAKAAGKHYDNRFAVSSWEPWLTFDGISSAQGIEQPVFIVHSESGAVPQGAKSFYEQLNGEKDIVWLNDYNQQQLYFEEEAVNSAVSEVVGYLSGK
ncbi:MAG: nuclear transport factor 2 family protein [Bacteroidota bacterium]